MRQILSVCGLLCNECHFFDTECQGCYAVEGKTFWAKASSPDTFCPLYKCAVIDNNYNSCGQCSELPCNKFIGLKDPEISDEQHYKSIDERASRLKDKEGQMRKKQWYETLFENYAEKYDKECFTQGTIGECDFLEKELNFDKSLKIIDIGCGTGRHAIELSKRGYSVTGIDLSESMLARAQEKALKNNLKINFLKCDARNLPFNQEFDVAIMLCEGAFPLMETDEMNYEILKNVSRALKSKAKFIFTTLNGLFPLYHSIGDFHTQNAKEDNVAYDRKHFDLMTFRDHSITTVIDDHGVAKKLECNERYYVPSEITWLLKTLGFSKIEIFGAKLGAFSREDKLTPEDYEMLVIAER